MKVMKTYPGTYFCAIQFPPSGYCGLQELANGSKVAIFSIWDKGPKGSPGAEALASGKGFVASKFGGEGEGCRILGPFDWSINEQVVFRVTWKQESNPKSTFGSWQINCWANDCFIGSIRFHAGPLARSPVVNLLSFVEDFDRQIGKNGIEHERMAFFSQVEWPQCGKLSEVKFTRVDNGLDSTGVDRTKSGVISVDDGTYPTSYILCTGGAKSEHLLSNGAVIWRKG
jgi:hypothetical protein